jgi:hypothetical protein
MGAMLKIIKRFINGFINFADVGFRYIDVPRYNTKQCHAEGAAADDRKKASA